MATTDRRSIFHSHQKRPLPKIDMPRSQREIWQDRFSGAAILASIIAIILQPEGTSPGIFALVASAILIFGVTTILRRYPHEFNYIVQITPENAGYQYRRARELLGWIKVETAWLFLFLQIIIELLAITTGLIVILALLLVFTLGFIAINGTLVYYVLRMSDPGVRD